MIRVRLHYFFILQFLLRKLYISNGQVYPENTTLSQCTVHFNLSFMGIYYSFNQCQPDATPQQPFSGVFVSYLIKTLEDLLLDIPGNSTTAVSYRYFNHPLLSPDSNLYILSFRCIFKSIRQ